MPDIIMAGSKRDLSHTMPDFVFTNWLKFPWEMKRLNAKPVSDEDIDDLLADINAANATK